MKKLLFLYSFILLYTHCNNKKQNEIKTYYSSGNTNPEIESLKKEIEELKEIVKNLQQNSLFSLNNLEEMISPFPDNWAFLTVDFDAEKIKYGYL
jgi:hypothetical protein